MDEFVPDKDPMGPPKRRDVARPVANLGNTCYMNAVLQALAHAPELCMAMDVSPHAVHCPIYAENSKTGRCSPSSSPETVGDTPPKTTGTRKSRRSGKRSPSAQSSDEDGYRFCALCELEHHLARVHTNTSNRDKPVAPTEFVSGFIDHEAPHFKMGQQEDSHEFLRLLIDAMQRSCKLARSSAENPQDTPPPETNSEEKGAKDMEYPFQLFRGTVESKVTCSACKHCSSTRDPIEDIGLDVSPSNPGSTASGHLVDVSSALQRFARAEKLDSGYKCEECGLVGQAKKESRLASIPPILTLHLKRFRYGDTQTAVLAASSGSGSRRSNRSSEVSQLLGSNSSDFFGGKSGSAKIEGHSKFEQILDLKPYLTEEMQVKHSKVFCRLFAVIVHAGKNSHSGHYIAYVRNIAKNEWWKMDDARITVASMKEVMNAEAYMLLYRVVDHPYSVELREEHQKLRDEWKQKGVVGSSGKSTPASIDALSREETSEHTPRPESQRTEETGSIATSSIMSSARSANTRKRKAPPYTCGDDWARAKTSLPESVICKFKDIEEMISEYVQFKPEFFKLLTDQAAKRNARVGHGPSSGICEDDIVEGTGKIKRALLEVFYELDKARKGSISFFGKRAKTKSSTCRDAAEQPRNVLASSVLEMEDEALL